MNEVMEFAVVFSSIGLLPLKNDLDGLRKQMDDIAKNMQSSSKHLDGFGDSLSGLLKKLGLTLSITALVGAAIKNAFNVSDRTLDLFNMADAAGVAAENIEAMGIALRKYGGDEKSAGAMYKNFRDLITEYNQGKIPENQREVMARYGFNIRPGMSPEEVAMALSRALHSRVLAGDVGGRNQIAEAFGLDQSTMLFLSKGTNVVAAELAEANKQLVLSTEENRRNSEALREARTNLKQTWDNLSAQLIPAITEVTKALEPLVELLAPIAAWAAKQVGGIFADMGAFIKYATGKITKDQLIDYIDKSQGLPSRGARFITDMLNPYRGASNTGAGIAGMSDAEYAAVADVLGIDAELLRATNELRIANTNALNAAGPSSNISTSTTNTYAPNIKVVVPGRFGGEQVLGEINSAGFIPATLATGVQ